MELEELKAELLSDEPDYSVAERLTDKQINWLIDLVEADSDPVVSVPAIWMVLRADGDDIAQVLKVGSRSRHPDVRLAVASALNSTMPKPSQPRRLLRRYKARHEAWVPRSELEEVANSLLGDSDPLVSAMAHESVGLPVSMPSRRMHLQAGE